MNVRTDSVHFDADQKLLDYINRKLRKLNQYYDQIVDANVILRLENSGQVRDKVVEIKLKVPGELLFIKETSKTFESATDVASDRLKRKLIKYKEIQRGR